MTCIHRYKYIYLLIKCIFILTLKHDKEIAIRISFGKSSQHLGAIYMNVLDSLLDDLVSTVKPLSSIVIMYINIYSENSTDGRWSRSMNTRVHNFPVAYLENP